MKILIADKFSTPIDKQLKQFGFDVVYDPSLEGGALAEAVKKSQTDVLVVRSTKVNADVLQAGVLSVVIRAGAGTNTIDIDTASQMGIYVANCPGKNAIAVAEVTMGHLLNMDRRISDNTADLKQGVWNKKEYSKARGIYGLKLGLVGMGSIGKEVVKRAKSFGMYILVYSGHVFSREEEMEYGVEYVSSLEDIALRSDVISVHIPLNKETKNILGAKFFDNMKDGAYFINTSRGGVVDDDALEKAIKEKNIRVGLDVWNNQPSNSQDEFHHKIAQMDFVYGTHHIGASTDQAQQAISDEVIRIVNSYKDRGAVPNCVNRSDSLVETSGETYFNLIVRHYNRVGTLALILETLKENNVNVLEMENVPFVGNTASCSTFRINKEISENIINKFIEHKNIISVRLC